MASETREELDLVALWQVLWGYRLLIAVSAVIFALGAVYYALTATEIYRAEVVLTDAREVGGSGAESLSSTLGGLAGLAGIGMGPDAAASREAHAVLKSRRLAEEFIRRKGIAKQLETRGEGNTNLWFAVRRFQKSILSLREDNRSGVTTVAVEWRDAKTAADWANDYVALANEINRKRALESASRNIAYLEQQIAKTNVVELRRVMYNLVESETKTLMLANARHEYAFTVVDPAVEPATRVKPQRTIIVLAAVIVGAVVGVLLALLHRVLRAVRTRTALT
jgi:uncharacterized protein involved in exopolysaccharide biosynthesis